jgi:hypothetical protein
MAVAPCAALALPGKPFLKRKRIVQGRYIAGERSGIAIVVDSGIQGNTPRVDLKRRWGLRAGELG